MSERRRRGLLSRLLPWLFVFVAGLAAGYWFRDQQQDREIREAVANTRQEMEQKGIEAIRRGRRAAENVGAGARVAADSALAAFRELTGDTARRDGQ